LLVPAGGWPYAHDGNTHDEPAPAGSIMTRLPTVAERDERPIPVLRLVTGGPAAEGQRSGGRPGGGGGGGPPAPGRTGSRGHARFTYAEGQWWVTNLGRNGLTLNGMPLAGRRPVRDGDSIRWGSKADAPTSRVEVR